MGRRKPLQPLSPGLPETHREFTEELRSLYERIGLTLVMLGKELNVSDSSLSRYLNARTRIPEDVLDRLAELAKVSPAELQRLKALRQDASAATVVRDVPPPSPAVPPERRRPFRRTATIAVLATATCGMVAVLPAVTAKRPLRAGQVSCVRRPQYRVSDRGNVLDASGHVVGMVWKNDLFTRVDSAARPRMRYRYYGTVDGGPAGYVMQAKLDYYRPVRAGCSRPR